MANRVKVIIYNTEYSIITEESPEYLKEIAADLDKTLVEIMENDGSVSITQALVLCALSYLDTSTKEERNADNLRSQVQSYLEEVSETKTELTNMQREIALLRKENQQLKSQLLESSMPDDYKKSGF